MGQQRMFPTSSVQREEFIFQVTPFSSYFNSLSLINGCPQDAEWRNLVAYTTGTLLHKDKSSPSLEMAKRFIFFSSRGCQKKGNKKKKYKQEAALSEDTANFLKG